MRVQKTLGKPAEHGRLPFGLRTAPGIVMDWTCSERTITMQGRCRNRRAQWLYSPLVRLHQNIPSNCQHINTTSSKRQLEIMYHQPICKHTIQGGRAKEQVADTAESQQTHTHRCTFVIHSKIPLEAACSCELRGWN